MSRGGEHDERSSERERDSLLVVSDVPGPWRALCPVGRDAQSEFSRPATSSPNLGENKPSPWGKRHRLSPCGSSWHRRMAQETRRAGQPTGTARHYHSPLSSQHVNMYFVHRNMCQRGLLGVQIWTHVNSESLSNLFQVNATKKMSAKRCQISSWENRLWNGMRIEGFLRKHHGTGWIIKRPILMTAVCLPRHEIKQTFTY